MGLSAEGFKIWQETKQGFVSPEQALEYARKEKVQGVLRVVRVASDEYFGSLVAMEPVFEITKVKNGRKVTGIIKGKAARKVVEVKAEQGNVTGEAGVNVTGNEVVSESQD